jgi:drug/metabolite transporter (DMT)-like permease
MSDAELWLGLAAALAAAGCYETSYVVQAMEARAVDSHAALRASLLLSLARRPAWVGAISLAVAGWALQILALGLAPLTLVQPAIACGLLLLLYLGVRVLGEHVTSRQLAAAVAIVAGVTGIALCAPARVDSMAAPLPLAAVLGALGAVTVAPYASRSARGKRGPMLVASAGAADAWAAFAAKLVSDELSNGRVLRALAWAAGAAIAVLLGLTSETTALQRLPATRVAPLVLVIQTAVPVLLAPLLVGEDWGATPLGGVGIGASFALVAAGTLVLASSRLVGDLLAPPPDPPGLARDALEHEGGGRRQLCE